MSFILETLDCLDSYWH